MDIQQYKARISHSEDEIIGYMIIVSDHNYLMAVTEKTMPGMTPGTYSIDPKSATPWPDHKRQIPSSHIRINEEDFISALRILLSELNIETD